MVKVLKSNNLYTLTSDLLKKDVVIYGTSVGAVHIYKTLRLNNINVVAFTDSYVEEKEEQKFLDLPVITLKKLVNNYSNTNIVVGTNVQKYMQQIVSKLNELGLFNIYASNCNYVAGEYDVDHMKNLIDQNKTIIDYVYESLADEESKRVYLNLLSYRVTNDNSLLEKSYEKGHKQYFPDLNDHILQFGEEEVFVDAGAYDGTTSFDFANHVGFKYKKIYALEPDDLMFPIVKELFNIKKLNNAEVIQAGLYSETTKIGFLEDPSTGSSSINEDNKNASINTVSLDELLFDKNEKITFIKMDIEGVEAEALDGANKVIQRDKPKLAISIYHKEDDLWNLPYKLLKEYPGYKIYIRHYTDITTETVCYAVL